MKGMHSREDQRWQAPRQPAHGCPSGFTLAPERRAGTQLEYKIVGRCPGRLVKAGAGPPHAATMALGACLTAAALGP
jgi:hypothetical protein